MGVWQTAVDGLTTRLKSIEFTDESGRRVDADCGFGSWVEMAVKIREEGRTIYFGGNGASASMGSHFAADVRKNARIHTEVFHDIALLTAIANDLSYEEVLAAPLRWHAQEGSLVVLISSSGASPNILAAAKGALEKKLSLVTLSGMKADNPLRSMGGLNLYVPAISYGDVETIHSAVLHFWMDQRVV